MTVNFAAMVHSCVSFQIPVKNTCKYNIIGKDLKAFSNLGLFIYAAVTAPQMSKCPSFDVSVNLRCITINHRCIPHNSEI